MIVLKDSKIRQITIYYEDEGKQCYSGDHVALIESVLRKAFNTNYNTTQFIDPISSYNTTVIAEEIAQAILNSKINITPTNQSLTFKMEDMPEDLFNYNSKIDATTTATIGLYTLEGSYTETSVKKLEEFGFKKRNNIYGNVFFEGDSGKLPILKIHGINLKDYVPTP